RLRGVFERPTDVGHHVQHVEQGPIALLIDAVLNFSIVDSELVVQFISGHPSILTPAPDRSVQSRGPRATIGLLLGVRDVNRPRISRSPSSRPRTATAGRAPHDPTEPHWHLRMTLPDINGARLSYIGGL